MIRVSYLILFFVLCVGPRIFGQQDEPHVDIITTQFERIEIVRMRSGTDLLEGLNQAVETKNIKNAIILAGIGSVTDYHYHVVSSKDLPPDQEYPKASVPMDMTTVQGYILNGKVHAHLTLSDENSMVGGHLEPGTKALTFFIVTIGILPDDINLVGLDSYKY